MIIAICGFMGAGKSTFLKMFPEVSSIDLDEFMTEALGRELGDFIRENGWVAFRELESESLALVLEKISADTILALGGGVLDEKRNLGLLKDRGVKLLHLSVDFDEAMDRIKGDKNRAQLDKKKHELLELYEKREGLFKEVSDVTLPAESQLWPTDWSVLKSFF